MNIKDHVWDKIVSECIYLAEYLEKMPKEVVIPAKGAILSLAHTIINLDSSPIDIDEITKSIGRLEEILGISKKKISRIKKKSKTSIKST